MFLSDLSYTLQLFINIHIIVNGYAFGYICNKLIIYYIFHLPPAMTHRCMIMDKVKCKPSVSF